MRVPYGESAACVLSEARYDVHYYGSAAISRVESGLPAQAALYAARAVRAARWYTRLSTTWSRITDLVDHVRGPLSCEGTDAEDYRAVVLTDRGARRRMIEALR